MADPILIALWKSGELFGSQFLGGVVGNLVASAGYDIGKVGLRRFGERLRELVEPGEALQNHNLLRALLFAEYEALAALCEITLIEDHRVEPKILNAPAADWQALLARFRDADARRLLTLRRDCREAASDLAESEPEELEAKVTLPTSEVPALIRAGSELAQAEDFAELRSRATAKLLERLAAVLSPEAVPAGLERRLESSWFDYLRVAFRERLKADSRAKAAFDLNVLGRLDRLPELLDRRLDRLDTSIEAVRKALQQIASGPSQDADEACERIGRQLDDLRQRLDRLIGGLPIRPWREPPPLTGDPNELRLVDAARRATPLVGREADLESLLEWLHSERAISVRVITGQGGAGKTRLAIELLRRIQREKGPEWEAGFVLPEDIRRYGVAKYWPDFEWRRPTLIVLDYAGTLVDPLLSWLEYLAAIDGPERPPLRLLLLERHASAEIGWLGQLLSGASTFTGARTSDLFDPRGTQALRPLATALERRQVLQAILDAIASSAGRAVPVLPGQGADLGFDRRLEEPRWAEPLALIMAALVAAEKGPGAALSLSRADLACEVARREQRRLRQFVPLSESAQILLVHMAAYTTLTAGLSNEDAVNAARQELAALDAQWIGGAHDLVNVLTRALPDTSKGILPIQPDVVGEAFVWLTFGDGPATICPAPVERAARHKPTQAAATLVRMVQSLTDDSHHRAVGPLPWVEQLVSSMSGGDLAFHRALEAVLPPNSVRLRKLAAKVLDRLIKNVSEQPTSDTTLAAAERARLLNNLAIRMSALGRRAEALEPAEEAVRLRRKLAQANPNAFDPHLATSLNNLAIRLSELGRRAEALDAAEEAVRLRRKLAQANPDAFEPDLASSLNTLANRLSALGRRAESLEPAEEAVLLYRDLAQANPDAFDPDLATSLNNLAIRLSELGRRAEALEPAKEAVLLYRKLAQANPDAFDPGLASSLNNVATRLSALGRRAEALEPAKEAVLLYRKLAQANPDAFEPDLATSLNNLATFLSKLGRRAEALEPAEEAVRLRRKLAQANPDAFEPDLASSLNNLANRLSALGRRTEALGRAEEAMLLYRKLTQANPNAFEPDLATSLSNLANCLSELGRRAEALEPAEEAVRLRRKLAQANPDAFEPDLASSLNNLANRLSELGQLAEALEPAEEAVRLRRKLAQANPDAFEPDLATTLNNLAVRLSELGRRAESLEPAEEAVLLYRKLAQTNPDAFEPDLASSLNNLANCLSALGRRAEAVEPAEEAVRLRRKLAQANPDAFEPDLATSLNNLATFLSKLGRRAEALEPAEEAVLLYRKLAQANSDAFEPGLASSLNNLANCLSALRRWWEALEPAEEAVRLRRKLAEADPDVFEPDLAMSLGMYGAVLEGNERREEASVTFGEGVRVLTRRFLDLPEAFGPLMTSLLRNYLQLTGTPGHGSDLATVRSVVECLARVWQEPEENA